MIIVHTPKLEDYIEVVKWAIGEDKEWNGGGKGIWERLWNNYRHETCVLIKDRIMYCSMDWATNNYKNILDMKQFREKIGVNRVERFGKKYNLK